MPAFEASISIAAPREPVWAVLAGVAAWPKWLPTVTSVQAHDGEPLKLGARYTVRQPKLRPATWVVTELRPPYTFVWEARSPGLAMIASHTIEVVSPNSSRVTLRFEFAGLLGTPIAWLFRSITGRYLAQEAKSLKCTVEGQG